MSTRRDWLRAGLLAAGIALVACVAQAEPVRITILQVNDWDRYEESRGRGGFPRVAALLRAEGAERAEVLVVHAGDAISPSLLSGFDKGAHIIDLLNRLPIDVFTPGNHEFDFGKEIARQRFAQARFPILSANIAEPDGSAFAGLPASRIVEVAGFKLGFFGMTTPQTKEISSPGDLVFSPPIEVAPAMAKKLREQGADLVVAVTHTGFEEDLALYRQGAVDLILSGHDHDIRIMYNGRVAMVESGAQGEFVTAIDLALERIKEGERTRLVWTPSFRTLDTAAYSPDPETKAVTAALEQRLARELDVTIGKTATPLDSRRAVVRGEEAAIGNLIADAMRLAVDAELAITNGGGIRGDRQYPAGHALTRRDLLTELPFGNKTVKLALKGSEILEALENGFSQVEQGAGRFPQVSGMRVTVDLSRPAGRRVTEVLVGGAPLDPERTYTVATNDFLARGGDGYAVFARAKALIDPAAALLMASQVIDYVATRGEVAPTVEGRIVIRR
ncbi:MAG: bifunctional metallophosphatase/5'-nucleotidase [Geminicoccaceae bacterium]|nr:bifunctional metallophosphatase/5'-nucleotidase [Geminicoccaceae bacterium]MCS7268716.1 bifunctional metallophosphatase/5'-nucleotidase [Geminicoccaceae bacterium]MCX7629082.1 bifunctional metallophosphatase/5'-nucleotidase [Geminicoccaceae bacterium]MDW8125567.1 bifunctional UDP-sugar hydrolase/5'-nucleotidase [Geminicoccaceae bacterium]MDW8342210.1 bifunctional UDP-sugar hydrolase/5'-nucleotidase [Geminicoccaceae bacterium]